MKVAVGMLSKRFLMGKKKNNFLSFISFVSLFGVALGVMALIVVMAVMEGFETELKSLITNTHSHIAFYSQKNILYNDEKLIKLIKKDFPDVVSVQSYIFSEVMVANRGRVQGSLIEGVKKEDVARATKILDYLVEGSFPQSLKELHKEAKRKKIKNIDSISPGIVLGKFLSEDLGVKIGDTVSVISPYFNKEDMQPRVRYFQVSGIISTGLYEYDSKYSLIHKEEARAFFKLPNFSSTALRILTKDSDSSSSLVKEMRKKFKFPYTIRDWTELNHNLLYAVNLQKVVIFIILASIVVVASFNIMSTLVIMMDEKKKDMSIVKAMGMIPKDTALVFLTIGFTIAVLGIVSGVALGLLLCKVLLNTSLVHLSPEVYFISRLPLEIDSLTLCMIMVSALCISLIASLYPAWKVAKEAPIYGLRYE